MIDVEVFPMVKERVPPNLREPQIKKLIKKWLVGQGLKEKDDFETEYCPIGSYALDRLDFCVFSEFGKIAIEVKGHVNGPHHRITSLLDQVMRYLRWIPWLIIVVHNGRMVGSIQRFIGDILKKKKVLVLSIHELLSLDLASIVEDFFMQQE